MTKHKYRIYKANKHMMSKSQKRSFQDKQITIWSFWLIKQVERSIVPLAGILGNGCDSSQHHLTSRTNSIHSTAIANKREYNQVIGIKIIQCRWHLRKSILHRWLICSYPLIRFRLYTKETLIILGKYLVYCSFQTKENVNKIVRREIQVVRLL